MYLDARLAALVRDQRGRGVQAADQGAVAAGWLPGIGMPGQHERVIQREDHGEVRRRQGGTPAWRYPEYHAMNGRSEGAGTPRTDSSTRGCAAASDLRIKSHRNVRGEARTAAGSMPASRKI